MRSAVDIMVSFCGGGEKAPLGVSLEVLRDLTAAAAVTVKAQYEERAAASAGSRRPALPAAKGGLFSRGAAPPKDEPQRSFESRVNFEMIATRVTRPAMQHKERPFVSLLQSDPMLLKGPEARDGAARAQVGRANVLLVLAEIQMAERYVAALQAVEGLPTPTFFYNQELCSVDLMAATAHVAGSGEPPLSAPKSAGRRGSNFASPRAKPSKAPGSPGMLDLGAADPGLSPGATDAAALQQRRAARNLASRHEFWAKAFPRAVAQLSKAVFVLDKLNELTLCEGARDMHWLYALHVAHRELGAERIAFVMPPGQKAALDSLLLQPDLRPQLFREVRAISLERSSARSPEEAEAIGAAMAGQLAEASRAFSLLFTAWMLQQCSDLVQSRLEQLDAAGGSSTEQQNLYELMSAAIDLRVMYLHMLADQQPAKGKGAARQEAAIAAPLLEDACWRANRLFQYSLQRFGEADEHTIVACGKLANMLGSRPDKGSLLQAVDKYERVVRLSKHRPGALNEERMAGTHMSLGNTLRDLGRHEDALPHFREALRLSAEGGGSLGRDSLNAQFCRVSLGNALRTLREGLHAPSAEDVRRARKALASAPPGKEQEAAAALAAAEASHERAASMLVEAEQLYREAHNCLLRHYKHLVHVALSAKLNHTCVLIEMATKADDKWEREATAMADELHYTCTQLYGQHHEATAYASAKMGELKARFHRDPLERAAGRKRIQDALREFERLGLPPDHPRVKEVRRAKALRYAPTLNGGEA